MRISTSTPGPKTIAQTALAINASITPNTAAVDLLRLSALDIHDVPVRVTVTGKVLLSGTTNTVRTVTFQLVHGAGAGTLLQDASYTLPVDYAPTSGTFAIAMSFILNPAVANATDTFAVRWATSANATATIDATSPGSDCVLNVEELTALNVSVGPIGDELVLGTAQGNDPINLATSIGGFFASVLTDAPLAQLVDVSISGGGAGNIYFAEFILRLPQLEEDVAYPPLADMVGVMAWGGDRRTIHTSASRWLDDDVLDDAVLEAWAEATSGDGAQSLVYFLVTPPDDEGPGLLAAIEGAPSAPSSKTVMRIRDLVDPSVFEREFKTERAPALRAKESAGRFAASPPRASGNTPPREIPRGLPKQARTRFESSPKKG